MLPILGDRAFASAAPTLWNILPRELTSIQSLAGFKSNSETYLFRCLLLTCNFYFILLFLYADCFFVCLFVCLFVFLIIVVGFKLMRWRLIYQVRRITHSSYNWVLRGTRLSGKVMAWCINWQ